MFYELSKVKNSNRRPEKSLYSRLKDGVAVYNKANEGRKVLSFFHIETPTTAKGIPDVIFFYQDLLDNKESAIFCVELKYASIRANSVGFQPSQQLFFFGHKALCRLIFLLIFFEDSGEVRFYNAIDLANLKSLKNGKPLLPRETWGGLHNKVLKGAEGVQALPFRSHQEIAEALEFLIEKVKNGN